MGRWVGIAAFAACVAAYAQATLSPEDAARVDTAVHSAFAFLYALPPDTQGERMGTWVLDSSATGRSDDEPTHWRIAATKLTDTGKGLSLDALINNPGNSPAQLAAAMAEMQRLEGKVSKAEADASLEVIVIVNADELSVSGVSDDTARSKPVIAGAQTVLRLQGDWMHVDDRELEVDYERWSPPTLILGFGAFTPIESQRRTAKESAATFAARARSTAARSGLRNVAVTVQGNDEMVERVIKETNWAALASLLK